MRIYTPDGNKAEATGFQVCDPEFAMRICRSLSSVEPPPQTVAAISASAWLACMTLRAVSLTSAAALLLASCSQSWGKFWEVSFTVTAISPQENSTENSTQSPISVTLNNPVALATLTTNASDTNCSGTLQLSVNDFYSCIRIPTLSTLDGGRTISIGHVGVPNGQTAKVRLTTGLQAANGLPLTQTYTSVGFRTTNPPCGTGNCLTVSNAIGATLGLGAHAFRIQTGTQQGNYVLVAGGATNTTRIFDVTTATFSAGPSLGAPASGGGHSISITTGPNAGKTLVFHGGSTASTEMFDPATNTFSANAATTTSNITGASHSYALRTGPSAGKFMTIFTGSQNSEIYDPNTNTFTVNSAFTCTPGGGANSFFADSGLHVLICAGAQLTEIYDPMTQTFTAGNATGQNISTGSINFRIPSGTHQGKQIITRAGATNGTVMFDPSTGTYSAGPTTTSNVNSGSSNFAILYGANKLKVLLVLANVSALTNFYDPETHQMTNVDAPTLPFTVNGLTTAFVIEGGLYPGAYVITGGGGASYAIYFP